MVISSQLFSIALSEYHYESATRFINVFHHDDSRYLDVKCEDIGYILLILLPKLFSVDHDQNDSKSMFGKKKAYPSHERTSMNTYHLIHFSHSDCSITDKFILLNYLEDICGLNHGCPDFTASSMNTIYHQNRIKYLFTNPPIPLSTTSSSQNYSSSIDKQNLSIQLRPWLFFFELGIVATIRKLKTIYFSPKLGSAEPSLDSNDTEIEIAYRVLNILLFSILENRFGGKQSDSVETLKSSGTPWIYDVFYKRSSSLRWINFVDELVDISLHHYGTNTIKTSSEDFTLLTSSLAFSVIQLGVDCNAFKENNVVAMVVLAIDDSDIDKLQFTLPKLTGFDVLEKSLERFIIQNSSFPKTLKTNLQSPISIQKILSVYLSTRPSILNPKNHVILETKPQSIEKIETKQKLAHSHSFLENLLPSHRQLLEKYALCLTLLILNNYQSEESFSNLIPVKPTLHALHPCQNLLETQRKDCKEVLNRIDWVEMIENWKTNVLFAGFDHHQELLNEIQVIYERHILKFIQWVF